VFLCVIISHSAWAGDADEAYRSARECYSDLRSDKGAQGFRENWERCIGQFEAVAKKYRKTGSGADALYSLGRLYEELAYNSKNQADWLKSKKMYTSFAVEHPRDSKADDAYFRVACIEWERFHDKASARKNLLKIIKYYRDGDTAGEAAKYLKNVDAGIIPEETVPNYPPAKGPAPKNQPVGPLASESVVSSIVIVIDPGHGGADTGAVGSSGTQEKDVVLAISKKLSAVIGRKIKNAKVYLTRSDDKTLDLDDRVKFANGKKADVFISIHANAAPSKKESGVQTYFLNNATDAAAERLALQENKNSGRRASDLDKIIATMLQNASTDESRELAGKIHSNLLKGLSKKYSGVSDQKIRSALFYVLVGAKCPSVLVETSYVSNPKEEKRLKDEKYQTTIAESVADGIMQHMRSAGAMTTSL